MIDIILPMLWLALAAGLALGIVELMIRRPVIALGFVLSSLVYIYADIGNPSVSVGPVSVYIDDMIFSALLAGLLARLLRVQAISGVQYLVVLLSLVGVVSLLRGLPAFGLEETVDEARPWIFFFVAALYFSTVAPREETLERMGRVWVIAGLAMVGLAGLRWLVLATGLSANPGLLKNPGGDIASVLQSNEALLVALPVLILAPSWLREERRHYQLLSALFFLTTVMLLHRTIWVATTVGLAILLYHSPELFRRFGGVAVGATVVALVAATFFLGGSSEDLQEDALNDETFAWRVGGWNQLVVEEGLDGVVEWALGKPFGSGWARRVDQAVREVAPHSFYVEALLRFGVTGVVLMLSWLIAVYRSVATPRAPLHGRHLLEPGVMPALVATSAIYGLAYHPEIAVAIVLGTASVAGGARLRARDLPGDVDAKRISSTRTQRSMNV